MTNYIYAYTHAGRSKKWKRATGQRGDFPIKVGETSKSGISRVKQQLTTAFPGLEGVDILFHSEVAEGPDGKTFSDHDVRKVLTNHGVVSAGGEWVQATLEECRGAVVSLQTGLPFDPVRTQTFEMRDEQRQAVNQTAQYFRDNAGDCLLYTSPSPRDS